jgi:hypothetical protein
MLKRNRLKYLMLIPVFMTPNTLTPFQNQAWQHIKRMLKITKWYYILIN